MITADEKKAGASANGGSGVTAASKPEPATRLEGFFARLDGMAAWCDSHLQRWLPAEYNPLAQSGAAANYAVVVAVVSGVALLGWYSPSLPLAYSSVEAMAPRTWGGWVRAMHRYSSDLAMLFIVVHAGRMLLARKFGGTRWLPWVSGVGLIALVWFIGWTGYWLVWDQPAKEVAVSSMRLLDVLPVFGEPLARHYVADRLVPSLLFFVVFFTHMLLPLGIAIGLALHLTRVSRAKLLPDRGLALALTAGLALAAVIVPAPLDAPARMAEKAATLTVDAWYLTPLALALRFQGAGLWTAMGGTILVAATLPWWLGRRRKRGTYQAVVEQARCHACTQCVQDCPFDAITMIPRTDGKKFSAQAFVDPAKCVGCGVCVGACDSEGISLPWFDTRREEARIESEIAATIAGGGSRWVAFVAGDIDGGPGWFAWARWRERLAGYQIHPVPTASWVRPKLVERLLAGEARGVLVVRDARNEAAARDGNRWVEMRFAGERAPVFRPQRAGGNGRWRVLDFDPGDESRWMREAADFRNERTIPVRSRARRLWRVITLGVVLAVVLGAAVVIPSGLQVRNPAPGNPEFVFSFKALGDFVAAVEHDQDDASKPLHMRGRPTSKPQRAPVVVRIAVDGQTEERSYRAKGISRDGPAIDEWRIPLRTGTHAIAIEVVSGDGSPASRWEGEIQAAPRRVTVVTFEPVAGFRVE